MAKRRTDPGSCTIDSETPYSAKFTFSRYRGRGEAKLEIKVGRETWKRLIPPEDLERFDLKWRRDGRNRIVSVCYRKGIDYDYIYSGGIRVETSLAQMLEGHYNQTKNNKKK